MILVGMFTVFFKTIPQNKSLIPIDVFTFMGEVYVPVYVPVSMQNQNCIFHNLLLVDQL